MHRGVGVKMSRIVGKEGKLIKKERCSRVDTSGFLGEFRNFMEKSALRVEINGKDNVKILTRGEA